MKIAFKATLQKYGANADKTGWTYFVIPAAVANKIKKDVKKSYRVKGTLDGFSIKQTSILPAGDGSFIMPFNAEMRKATRKKMGDSISVELEADETELLISADFVSCLADEPQAESYFFSLPRSHQNYYSKWIESAKTEPTKTRRIAIVINGLARKMDFGAMLREQKELKQQ